MPPASSLRLPETTRFLVHAGGSRSTHTPKRPSTPSGSSWSLPRFVVFSVFPLRHCPRLLGQLSPSFVVYYVTERAPQGIGDWLVCIVCDADLSSDHVWTERPLPGILYAWEMVYARWHRCRVVGRFHRCPPSVPILPNDDSAGHE